MKIESQQIALSTDPLGRPESPFGQTMPGGVFKEVLEKQVQAIEPEVPSTAPSTAPSGRYIASTGVGPDKNVHHRLPDGSPITYDDIRKAVAEGRGGEDVSPYFTGQTNEQALAAYGFSSTLDEAPKVVSTLFAISQRSIFSLVSALTDNFGATKAIKTALADSVKTPDAPKQ